MTRLTLKAILPYLGYVIAAGTALYTWGRKDESNKNNITGIEKNVNLLLKSDTLKTMQFAEFTNLLNEHLIATQKQENNFKALERSHVNTLTIINRLDEVIKYYESKARYERQVDSMKFPEVRTRIIPVKK
jgi:hypothetical protein